ETEEGNSRRAQEEMSVKEVEALRRKVKESEDELEEKNMMIVEGVRDKFWLEQEYRRLRKKVNW
ncbi:26575_t:CDS:1, partial [Racocetra persica]